VAITLAFGAYFVWWSLQVLDRLTAEYDAASAMVGPIFKFKRVSRPGVMDVNAGFGTPLGSQTHGYAASRGYSCICRADVRNVLTKAAFNRSAAPLLASKPAITCTSWLMLGSSVGGSMAKVPTY